MSLLADYQDPFGGPRRVRIPDFLTDTLPADVAAGGHRITKQIGEAVNLLDYAARDVATDQDTAINAAITAAAGRTLYVPKGTWWIGSGCTLLSNTTIVAEPGSMFKALPNDDYFVMLGANGKSNIRVCGLTLDGNDSFSSVAALQFYNCHDFSVQDCTIQNTLGIGINLSTTIVNARITGNRFYRTGNPDNARGASATLTINLNESVAGNSHNVKISNNTFDNVGLGCISFENTYEADVIGNYSKSSLAGFLYTQLGDSRRFRIVGNYSEAEGLSDPVSSNGFDLLNLSESVVAGNVSSGNGSAGLGLFNCQDISVVGNIFNNNNQDDATFKCGIMVGDDLGTSSRIVISGNICSDTQLVKTQQYGIIYDVISSLVIDESNMLSGNAVAELAVSNFSGTALNLTGVTRSIHRAMPVAVLNFNWNIPSTLANATASNTQAVSGVAVGDAVIVTPSVYFGHIGAEVSDVGFVKVTYTNTLGTTQDPVSQSFNITVFRTSA